MVEHSTDLLNQAVSFQPNAQAHPTATLLVREVLDHIKKGKYESKVCRLRQLLSSGRKLEYNQEKKTLPGVTFSGTFQKRRQQEALLTYNNLLVLDIDHLSDTEALTKASLALLTDPHVLASWLSPSGEGIKGLVGISYAAELETAETSDKHRAAFEQIYDYFLNTHSLKLDPTGKDITRLCFLSSDPALHIRHEPLPFTVSQPINARSGHKRNSKLYPSNKTKAVVEPGALKELQRTEGKNRPRDRKEIASIIKFLTKRHMSITACYVHWRNVGYAISSTFTHEIGEKYFLKLCRLDGAKHNEEESKQLLVDCYLTGRGEISFGTIWQYAHEMGYKEGRDRD